MVDTLVCHGNHGSDIASIYYRVYGTHIDFYDDDPSLGGIPLPPERGRILIGVNDPVVRREIAERFKHLRGLKPLVDPSAIVGPDCAFGNGSVVAPLASLLRSVTLGDHVHVNTHVNIVRSTVGDFTTISPGATICGNVEIGEESWIGANATICERSKIGNGVVVGAGAVVLPYGNVPDATTVVGVWKE